MPNEIPSVSKAVSLLLMLADRKQRLKQSEIVRQLGVTASTAYRILQTFAVAGLAAKDSNRRWGAAPGLLPFAYNMRDEVRIIENSRKVIDMLAYDRKIPCKISIRSGYRAVTLMFADPGNYMMVGEMQTASFPLIVGPTGAALVCEEPEANLLRFIRECDENIPEKRSPKVLFAAIESIRRKGWHHAPYVNDPNYATIAAPVRSADGAVIAALSFVGHKNDFVRWKIPVISKLLLASARACSSAAFVKR